MDLENHGLSLSSLPLNLSERACSVPVLLVFLRSDAVGIHTSMSCLQMFRDHTAVVSTVAEVPPSGDAGTEAYWTNTGPSSGAGAGVYPKP